jgi:hypothetical protein
MLRNPAARRKEVRAAKHRAKKQDKIAARQAARQTRKGAGAAGPPPTPKGGR